MSTSSVWQSLAANLLAVMRNFEIAEFKIEELKRNLKSTMRKKSQLFCTNHDVDVEIEYLDD